MPNDTPPFDGFQDGDALVRIPSRFFADLLPHIDSLIELQATLFVMWAVQQREGRYRFVTAHDLVADAHMAAHLATAYPDVPAHEAAASALGRMVERGTLRTASADSVTLYFINSPQGREAQLAVQQGRYTVDMGEQVDILPPRPTIYRLYEQEIGPLTPMIAEALRDIEADYPPDWIAEAFRIAVEKQARNLKFIRAVLDRWQKEGRQPHEQAQSRHAPSARYTADGRRIFDGPDADWIEQ